MYWTGRGQWLGFVAVAFVLVLFILPVACSRPRNQDLLDQHRNLGKAFYENPTTQQEAVLEFQKALELAPDSARDKLNYALALLRVPGREQEAIERLQAVQRQDPSLPHTWFNLGIYYKRQGDAKQAIAQFEGMLARTPDEAVAHYQLGTLYNQIGRRSEGQAQFEKAAELDPFMAAPRFQLYNLYRAARNAGQADGYLADFERIQKVQKSWVIPENVEWGNYAEIYDPPQDRAEAAAPPEPKFADTRLAGTVDPATAGLTLIDSTGSGQTDLLVWSSQGIRLFLKGQSPADVTGLEGLTGVIDVAPGDFDNDGLMDICVLTTAGPLLYRNTGGKFVRQPAKLPAGRFDAAVWMDVDHDYDLDLILLGPQPALMRNQGAAGWADRTDDFPFVKGEVASVEKTRVIPDSKAFDLAVFYRDRAPVLYRDRLGGRYTAEAFHGQPVEHRLQADADFDATGRLDRARIDADGSIHLLRNQSDQNHHWIRVQLKGVRSLKLAQNALVEMKAGTLYRRQFYAGVPLTFDAGDHTSVDVIRITWPNGLIQNEVRQATNQTYVYQEAQRLSGSCPMIWTWNGREFQFITDVLGVAPLGARDGDGSYFPVDHQEYVQIPGTALQPIHDGYEVRVTEELSEVSYLDQIQLYAVDHPAGTEIFTNEKFKGPPYPEFRLFSVKRRIYPKTARDDHGADVLPQLMAKDQRYPDHFRRSETGVADLHSLELDFGDAAGRDDPSGKAILLLNGWVDWPDGSTFRRASQESEAGLVMPYLQVQDAAGAWKTANPDMGMPAGKPKTIVVPVEFPSASRKVRIVTNLCVYWDEIFLSEDASDAPVKAALIPFDSADLHFRGFSETRIDAQRRQPDTFFYDHVGPVSFWNPTPGLYTRFGRVDNLLRDVDDQLVIMGSGDEVRLQFPVASLQAAPAGMTRDFLLKVDGWAKDRDPNTAFSSTVQPLPFHAMSRYPYPASEHFPRDAAHDSYQRTYNTRPAGVLIRPLASK
jgi:Tfp pilus assembly protein PilF